MRVLFGLLFCCVGAAEAAKSSLDDSNIREAVNLWLEDRDAAKAKYGHIATWDTSEVTDMEELFCADTEFETVGCNPAAASFNDDITFWDTSSVTCRTMAYWRSTPAAKRAAAARRRRATHKNSLPGARTPLPRSLPIVTRVVTNY